MIKKLIMKVLGIPTRAELLAALELTQAKSKESIDIARSSLDRLVALHENAIFEGEMHKMAVGKHIDLIRTRLAAHQSRYAERQIEIDILRVSIEADKAYKEIC